MINIAMSNNAKIDGSIPDTSSFLESFPMYAFEVTADIVLAVLLGVAVNQFTNWVAHKLRIGKYSKLIIQLILIILILYIMKIDSKYLYQSWKGQTNYGIIFTAVFLAVQKNVTMFMEDVFVEKE